MLDCMNNLSLCACMGPRGNDPHCPCKMYALGLEPTPVKPMTEEEREELKAAFQKIADAEQAEKFKFRTFGLIDK